MYWFYIFILFIYFNYIYCSVCNTHKTCGACIGHAFERCIWCADPDITENRCEPESRLNDNKWCQKTHIYNPDKQIESKRMDFKAKTGDEVQFIPRNIKIKVRPGVPVNFQMSYKPAEDFPIDLYFLMDLSYTMKPLKEVIQSQTMSIYEALKNITKNVRLGVGSFIDKPSFPYTDVSELRTYSFINHLSLTNNTKQFMKVIENLKFGANYDDPEGGLDALMQVMACFDQIGWRDGSRRIILVSTDNTYHSAGDGKFVGAYKPNDMKCHLKNNEYEIEFATKLDYPSVSQINKMATEKNFKIIFASSNTATDDYIALTNYIMNAKHVELNEKSNIVNIIRQVYEESVRTVKLNYNEPKIVELKLDQDCYGISKTNCESTPTNPIVNIPATIKVTECSDRDLSIKINPFGLTETLTIDIEVICKCSCESDALEPSSECNNSGTKQCGVCVCNENTSGDACQFNCTETEARKYYEKCKEQKDDVSLCNGHGVCRCGVCKCDTGFSGDFCQYNDNSCYRKNGSLCAGESHGICRYGQCRCKAGWTGKDCSCPDHDRDCIGPFSSKVCSGRGTCDCGKCQCIKQDDRNYAGLYCDACDECTEERCKELENYAYCNYIKNYEDCNSEYNETNNIIVKLLNKTDIDSPVWRTSNKCVKELPEGLFIFKYQMFQDSKVLRLLIQKELDQPSKMKIWLPVGLSIGLVILIGIITLIVWKILIDIYDKREYEKFCQEAKADGYDTSINPLYEGPAVNVVNPAYNRDEE